ncbi:MAG: hypothetical protein V8Q28_02805 [Alistipes sp.]
MMKNWMLVLGGLLLMNCQGCSVNPDSAWINALNEIEFPVQQDGLLNVYFKYNQIINGYEVTGRWMPFEPHSETGYLIMNFRDTINGNSFQYVNTEKYNSYDTDNITFSKDFEGYRNGDVYYFDYSFPDANDSNEDFNNSPIGYRTPFQFLDVNFDGEKELLINDWGRYQGGNHYVVYKITTDGLLLMDYPPFNRINNSTEFNAETKQIRLQEFEGVFDYSVVVFSDCATRITNRAIPTRLTNTTSGYILEEYYQQEQTDFRLDSIYQYGNQDSVYVYGIVGNRLALIDSIEYLKAL